MYVDFPIVDATPPSLEWKPGLIEAAICHRDPWRPGRPGQERVNFDERLASHLDADGYRFSQSPLWLLSQRGFNCEVLRTTADQTNSISRAGSVTILASVN